MHTNLADWYRTAGLEPGDWLPKRWAAIEDYNPEASEIIDLARFFFKCGGVTAASVAHLQNALQTADPTFKMSNNDQELRVLAGAALVDTMERGDFQFGILAALALVCASAQNLRKRPCVPEIPEIAARILRLSTISRKLPDNLTGPGAEMAEALIAAGAPHDKLAVEFRKIQAEVPVLGEEIDMLWWLFGGYSRDEGKPWADFSSSSAALMMGKELSDLARVLPGPPAAMAFLDKALKSAKPKVPASVPVKDAVNETTVDWRKKAFATATPANLDGLLPITDAIMLSIVSPKNDEWVPPFASKTGVPKAAKVAPELLSYQLFLERLLVRAWEAVK